MNIEDVNQQCKKLKLASLPKALEDQENAYDIASIPFLDRLYNLFSYELASRKNKKIDHLIRASKIRYDVDISQIDFSAERNLSKETVTNLLTGGYIKLGRNIVIQGATGTGKTYLASLFGQTACRQLYSVNYYRIERLLTTLAIARKTGDYDRIMRSLKKVDLLILDDFGMNKYTFEETKNLMELIEDRNESKSIIFISQLNISEWYQLFSDNTFADAIMDRISNRSTIISLKGESLRKENKNY